MGEVEAESQADRQGAGKPAKRLREFLTSIHRMNAERYVGDAKMHEMVAVAMEENWDGCRAHVDRITGAVRR